MNHARHLATNLKLNLSIKEHRQKKKKGKYTCKANIYRMFPLKQHHQGFEFKAAGFGSKCRIDDRESAGLRGMYLNAVDAGQGRADSYKDKTGLEHLDWQKKYRRKYSRMWLQEGKKLIVTNKNNAK